MGARTEGAARAGQDHGANLRVLLKFVQCLAQSDPGLEVQGVATVWSVEHDRGNSADALDTDGRTLDGFGTHEPLHTGERFSANAVAPSLASREAKTGSMNSRCATKASGSVYFADIARTCLVARTANGPFRRHPRRKFTCDRQCLSRFGEPIDQPVMMRQRGAERVTGDCDLHGQLIRQDLGQTQKTAGGSGKPPLHFGQARISHR